MELPSSYQPQHSRRKHLRDRSKIKTPARRQRAKKKRLHGAGAGGGFFSSSPFFFDKPRERQTEQNLMHRLFPGLAIRLGLASVASVIERANPVAKRCTLTERPTKHWVQGGTGKPFKPAGRCRCDAHGRSTQVKSMYGTHHSRTPDTRANPRREGVTPG